MAVTMQKTALLIKYFGTFQLGGFPLRASCMNFYPEEPMVICDVLLRRANSAKKLLVSRVFSLHVRAWLEWQRRARPLLVVLVSGRSLCQDGPCVRPVLVSGRCAGEVVKGQAVIVARHPATAGPTGASGAQSTPIAAREFLPG